MRILFNGASRRNGKVIGNTGCSDPATGISFQRSEVAIRHCTDGSSKTYLIGEKFMSPQFYETGRDSGDNETWCSGYNNDNHRTTSIRSAAGS